MEEGHFAPGSMLPKVQAAVDFASSKEGRTALITLLENPKTYPGQNMEQDSICKTKYFINKAYFA